MYYVCIENNQVISVLNYQPVTPETITIKEISDQEYEQVITGDYYFDTTTYTVLPCGSDVIDARAQQQQNLVYQNQLQKTDWQVLRHIRQKALGVPTSLSESEYLDLESERNRIAAQITH